jgi:uncharacterized protein (TIGR02246 family)
MAALVGIAAGCAPAAPRAAAVDTAAAHAGLDSLNARLSDAYRRRDPAAYSALYTDSGVFEWPAIDPVRGRSALAEMARGIWAAERDVELRLTVSTRRLATDHATELGAFEQTWTDSAGVRRSEFGRYATVVARQGDGSWRLDRFLGFEDSVRVADPRP